MRGKNLTNEERQHMAEFLLEHQRDGKILHTKREEAAAVFDCSIRTVSTIWALTRAQMAAGVPLDVRHRMTGHPPKNKKSIDMHALRMLPAIQRRTIRGTAKALGIGKSSVQRAVAAKVIKSHTNSIKPALTEQNKVSRMWFVLEKLDPDLRFRSMDHVIHIDEKWFYLSKPTVRYLLAPDEQEPYRTCKHKSHIPKLMFMCAVSRPIWGEDGELLFDGKLGIFPFVQDQVAVNNSKNRPAGTVEKVPIPKITRDVTRAKIIEDVIPAIKARWPTHLLGKFIHIQQDNAKPHISNNDPDFRAVAEMDGFYMKLVSQPANSPDCNILDLGFFNSIQSLQQEQASANVGQLMEAVQTAYEREDAVTLNKVFVTHQQSMIEILKARGSNKYKLPHMNKDMHIRNETLPRLLQVDEEVVRGSIEHLINKRALDETIIPLMHALGYRP